MKYTLKILVFFIILLVLLKMRQLKGSSVIFVVVLIECEIAD